LRAFQRPFGQFVYVAIEVRAVKTKERTRLNKIQREAEGYLELGLPQQALNTLNRLGNPVECGTTTQYLMGEALRALDRHGEALDPLRRAAESEPENVHIWLALGWCYKRTDRIDLAIGALDKALTADPNEPLLHYNLACYHSLAGHKSQVLDHLSRALAMDAKYRYLIDEEHDFDPFRNDADFQALTSAIV
jgi:tetratricopeptide (TPR) repeat protein